MINVARYRTLSFIEAGRAVPVRRNSVFIYPMLNRVVACNIKINDCSHQTTVITSVFSVASSPDQHLYNRNAISSRSSPNTNTSKICFRLPFSSKREKLNKQMGVTTMNNALRPPRASRRMQTAKATTTPNRATGTSAASCWHQQEASPILGYSDTIQSNSKRQDLSSSLAKLQNCNSDRWADISFDPSSVALPYFPMRHKNNSTRTATSNSDSFKTFETEPNTVTTETSFCSTSTTKIDEPRSSRSNGSDSSIVAKSSRRRSTRSRTPRPNPSKRLEDSDHRVRGGRSCTPLTARDRSVGPRTRSRSRATDSNKRATSCSAKQREIPTNEETHQSERRRKSDSRIRHRRSQDHSELKRSNQSSGELNKRRASSKEGQHHTPRSCLDDIDQFHSAQTSRGSPSRQHPNHKMDVVTPSTRRKRLGTSSNKNDGVLLPPPTPATPRSRKPDPISSPGAAFFPKEIFILGPDDTGMKAPPTPLLAPPRGSHPRRFQNSPPPEPLELTSPMRAPSREPIRRLVLVPDNVDPSMERGNSQGPGTLRSTQLLRGRTKIPRE